MVVVAGFQFPGPLFSFYALSQFLPLFLSGRLNEGQALEAGFVAADGRKN